MKARLVNLYSLPHKPNFTCTTMEINLHHQQVISQLSCILKVEIKRPDYKDALFDIDSPKAWYSTNKNGEINHLCFFSLDSAKISPYLKHFADSLTSLSFFRCQLSDLSFLENMKNIDFLHLANNKIENINVLAKLINLVDLNLSDNKIEDISGLRCLSKLNKLNLMRNKIADISAVTELTNLSELHLSYNRIKNIEPIKDLVLLQQLNLCENQIEDLQPIIKLKLLDALDLRNNPIKKLPPWICDFQDMVIRWKDEWQKGYINLYNNPLEFPPQKIAEQGHLAVENYIKEN
jgi:hypothetical protein